MLEEEGDSSVVTEEKEVGRAEEVMAPGLEGTEDGPHLLLISRFVELRGGEFLAVIGNDQAAGGVLLLEDGTSGEVGGVGGDDEGKRWVGGGDNRGGGASKLEGGEGGLMMWFP